MEQSDTSGSVADQAALFDDSTARVRGTRPAARKAQPAKRAPRKATVAATEVTTPPATAPVPPTKAKAAPAEKAPRKATKPAKPAKIATPEAPASKRTAKAATAKDKTSAQPRATQRKTAEPKPSETAEPAAAQPAAAEPSTVRADAEPAAQAITPPRRREPPLWETLVTEPRRTVDHAALAAVRELGPAAQRWLDQARQRYPTADADALARLATYEYRTAGGRRTAAVAGARLVGPFVVTGTLIRTQAEVVLVIAGAYGLDPTHPDRAADLMTVLHVRSIGPLVGLAVRMLADRAVPFGGAVAALAQHRRATADVAERARSHFRRYKPGM